MRKELLRAPPLQDLRGLGLPALLLPGERDLQEVPLQGPLGGGGMRREALEEVEEVLEELREESREGTPVLVEGRNDRGALLSLGVEGKIVHLHDGRSLPDLLEDLREYRRVIVLTDFDREGEELAARCSRYLRVMGVEPLLDPRERLKRLLRKEVKDVEGMAHFLLRLARGRVKE